MGARRARPTGTISLRPRKSLRGPLRHHDTNRGDACVAPVGQHDNSFRDKIERYIARDRNNADLRRKALSAITAKMARVVLSVIKTGADYRP